MTSTPEQDLWCAVIEQAFLDARKESDTLERQTARVWLTRPTQDFNVVCHQAGCDPEAVRDRAIAAFGKQEAPKNQGIGSHEARTAGRRNQAYTHDDLTMTIREWSHHLGLSRHALYQRLAAGLPFDQVFSTATRAKGRHSPNRVEGHKHVRDMARANNVEEKTFYKRRAKGLSVEQALAPSGEYTNIRLIEHKGFKLNVMQWSRLLGIDHTTIRKRLKRGYPLDVVFMKTDLRNPKELRSPPARAESDPKSVRTDLPPGGRSRLSQVVGDRRGELNARDCRIGDFQP